MRTAALVIAILASTGCSLVWEELDDPRVVEEPERHANRNQPEQERRTEDPSIEIDDAPPKIEPLEEETLNEHGEFNVPPSAVAHGPFLSPSGFQLFPPGHKYEDQPLRWYREDGTVDPDKWDPTDLDDPAAVAELERLIAARMVERDRRIARERAERERQEREQLEAAKRSRQRWLEVASGTALARQWHASREEDIAKAIVRRGFLSEDEFQDARAGRIEIGSSTQAVLVALGHPDSENKTTTRRGTEVTWHWRRGVGHVVVGFNAEGLVDYISDSRY